jgi:hypothetical protein
LVGTRRDFLERIVKVASVLGVLAVLIIVIYKIGEAAGILNVITDPANVFVAVWIAIVMIVVCYVGGCSSVHFRTNKVALQMPRPDGKPTDALDIL